VRRLRDFDSNDRWRKQRTRETFVIERTTPCPNTGISYFSRALVWVLLTFLTRENLRFTFCIGMLCYLDGLVIFPPWGAPTRVMTVLWIRVGSWSTAVFIPRGRDSLAPQGITPTLRCLEKARRWRQVRSGARADPSVPRDLPVSGPIYYHTHTIIHRTTHTVLSSYAAPTSGCPQLPRGVLAILLVTVESQLAPALIR